MTLVTVGFFFGSASSPAPTRCVRVLCTYNCALAVLDPMGREGTYLYMGLMRFILFLGHMTLLIWVRYLSCRTSTLIVAGAVGL